MFSTNDHDPDRMMSGNGMWEGSYVDGMMNGSGGMWVMAFLGVLLLAFIWFTVFLALKAGGFWQSDPKQGVGSNPDSARDVLDHRLARGEISQEEYGTTRTLLSS